MSHLPAIEPMLRINPDGTLTLLWPDPRPRTVLCSAEYIQGIIDEYNRITRQLINQPEKDS